MMRRVLHIITRMEFGGAQKNTLHTVRHLDRSRFEAGLAWGPGELLDAEARGLKDVSLFEIPSMVRPLAPLRDTAALRGIRAVIRSFRPHIVHTHSSKAGILGRLAARRERVPAVVHSVHGWGFTPLQSAVKRRLFLAAERWAAPWTTHFIAVSEANRRLGRDLGIIPKGRSSVIRSGIALDDFRELPDATALRRRLEIPTGAVVVTQVANFKPQKAPLDFVRAAAVIARRCPQAHFVMAGDGELRPAVETLIRELGLQERIALPGWVAPVGELLSLTDISVLTSRHEGLPRAVVEALAAGMPVVATDVDGTSEVLRDGENGHLVGPGRIDDVAERVCGLIEDGDLRRRMARAAPRDLEEFDIDGMVRRQEELYECLMCPES